jgi:endoplasmic reticulum-Golgi intermediate compartment protein 3
MDEVGTLRRRRRTGGDDGDDGTGRDDTELSKVLKKFDFHPKQKKRAVSRKGGGGAVSLVGLAVIVLLITSETLDYISSERQSTLVVDVHSRDERMRVELDISFHAIACAALSVDVVDTDGQQLADTAHEIVRTRLNAHSGEAIGHLQLPLLGSSAVTGPKWRAPPGYCGSCYEVAQLEPERCCNTCYELKKAYLQRGLDASIAQRSEQCVRELPVDDASSAALAAEGCRVRGHLLVRQTKGNFHVAAGSSLTQQHHSHKHHVHRIKKDELRYFNVSHHIHSLRFGDTHWSGAVHPLDERAHIESELVQAKYMLKIVPVDYYTWTGDLIQTFLYAASFHRLPVDLDATHYPLPGVFFQFDFNELRIESAPREKSFITFLVRICSIAGGVFVALGIVYQLSSFFFVSWRRRNATTSSILEDVASATSK